MKTDPATRKALVDELNVEPLLDSLLHVQLTAIPVQRVVGTQKLSRVALYGLVVKSGRLALLATQYARKVKRMHKEMGKK